MVKRWGWARACTDKARVGQDRAFVSLAWQCRPSLRQQFSAAFSAEAILPQVRQGHRRRALFWPRAWLSFPTWLPVHFWLDFRRRLTCEYSAGPAVELNSWARGDEKRSPNITYQNRFELFLQFLRELVTLFFFHATGQRGLIGNSRHFELPHGPAWRANCLVMFDHFI